jgi:hypothetical protein
MSTRSLITSAVLSAALASTASAQGPGRVELKEAQPGLIAMAGVRVEDALRTALSSTPGIVTTERIEKRGRQLVYVFGIRHNGAVHHVIVDAATGTVITPQAHAGSRAAKSPRKG